MNLIKKLFGYLLIFNSLLLQFNSLNAQTLNQDSCQALKFHSNLEEIGFKSTCSGQAPDYLKMSVAVNPKSDSETAKAIQKAVTSESNYIKNQLPGIKKSAKKLKFIFDHVQTTFLKQYDLESGFSELFNSGHYNCLTATILYSLLLDDCGIKYSIKFMPGHVYLMVYDTDDAPYIYETTDPIGGFIELDKTVQDKALQGLRVAQYINAGNKQGDKSNEFLDNYFVKLNNTEKKGLIGYQYVNMGVAFLTKQNYLDAYYSIEKAKVFTPIDELNTLSLELLGNAIDQSDKTSTLRAKLLVRFYSSLNNPNKKTMLTDDYKTVTFNGFLGSFPASDSMHLIHSIMMDGIKETEVRKVLDEIYSTNFLYYIKVKASPEKRFAGTYTMYAEGKNKELAKSILSEEINAMTENLALKPAALILYDSLSKSYPLLQELEIFRYNYCKLLVYLAEEAFREKDAILGEKYLTQIEANNAEKKNIVIYCDPASAFSVAGSYYFKKGNSAKAKAVLNRGLVVSPDNWELKKKLSEIR